MRHNNYAYRILFEKAKDPDKTAIAFGDRELSYRELQQCCNCFSAWITNSGIRTGSRIILVADKSEKSIAIALGIMLSGCTYIPVDAKMPNARLSYILETSKPDLVIYGEGLNKIFDI